MTTTDTTAAELDDSIRNGVDTATLFATLDAVKQAPEAASFQFRAHTSGSAAPTPAAPSPITSRWAKSAPMSEPSSSTPTIPLSWWARTTTPVDACASLDVLGQAQDLLGRHDQAANVFGRWAALADEAGLVTSKLHALVSLGGHQLLCGLPASALWEARALGLKTKSYLRP